MSRRTAWTVGFLTLTAAAIGAELYAAFDGSPNTLPWTDLLADNVPLPWTMAGAAILTGWLGPHLLHAYQLRRATMIPPTQTRHPWRATARTVLAALVGLASLAPHVIAGAHLEQAPGAAQVLAVAGAVTRVLALPGVEVWLRRYVPWLAAQPTVRG